MSEEMSDTNSESSFLSQGINSSLVDQLFNDNKITNILRTENDNIGMIEQRTFDYNNENELKDFIDFLDENSSNISYIPMDVSLVNNEVADTISNQHTAKARIFDQIADYCSTQVIESKNLKKKYLKMQKEINKIKTLEKEKNKKIKEIDIKYNEKMKKWVKKNKDKKALSSEDGTFNPEFQKFKEDYLQQKQQIEAKYRKKIELRKATYLHTHKFANWGKYINRNENYCKAKYGERWKKKMLNKDSKIKQNGAKYSDILEYLKIFLESEKNKDKNKDKESIIEKLIVKVKTWLGITKEEKTNKKDADIIKILEDIVTVYNALVKQEGEQKLNIDTISKNIVQNQMQNKKFNEIKQSFNERTQTTQSLNTTLTNNNKSNISSLNLNTNKLLEKKQESLHNLQEEKQILQLKQSLGNSRFTKSQQPETLQEKQPETLQEKLNENLDMDFDFDDSELKEINEFDDNIIKAPNRNINTFVFKKSNIETNKNENRNIEKKLNIVVSDTTKISEQNIPQNVQGRQNEKGNSIEI